MNPKGAFYMDVKGCTNYDPERGMCFQCSRPEVDNTKFCCYSTDENKSTAKNSSYGTLMKTIVLSIYIICVTYSAVHFNNAYILWWLLPILLT